MAVGGKIRCRASRDANHPLHEVDAGNCLGNAMLHLQPRIDLEEVERMAVCVVDEFDCAGGAVLHGLAQSHRGGVQLGPQLVREAGRRGFLDYLLVAPLHGAVAFAQRDHLALAIAEQLHLDVPRVHHILFDEYTAIAEVVGGKAAHAVEGAREVRG